MIVRSKVRQGASQLGVALERGDNVLPDVLSGPVMRGLTTLRLMGLIEIMPEAVASTPDEPRENATPKPKKPGPKKAGKRNH